MFMIAIWSEANTSLSALRSELAGSFRYLLVRFMVLIEPRAEN